MADPLELIGVRGPSLVRPGFYGSPDGQRREYTNSLLKKSTGPCVFCPDRINHQDIRNRFGKDGRFIVIAASSPYAHFDAQEVLDHTLIVPERHVESKHALTTSEREEVDQYEYEKGLEAERRGWCFQSYVRSRSNFSKSVPHLHYHGFVISPSIVDRFVFDLERGGVTELNFLVPTQAQISQVLTNRGALEARQT